MSEECTHNCSTCSQSCSDRQETPESFLAEANPMSRVKKVIAVVSGKGGVGKSLVSSLMAVTMQRRGFHTAILDADITGPSIPQAFGIHGHAAGTANGIEPMETSSGIKLMSINLLLRDEADPVIWRGPIIAGTVKQFWSEVCWGDVDYMFVDMPPGTGDVPLTVFQSLPINGIVVVTSPQELVGMIVEKAVRMAEMMNVPVLGLVENMSYFECPDCGKKHTPFGDSHIEELAKTHGVGATARLPINSKLAGACDQGLIELFEGDWLEAVADVIEKV
ncbi:MAG: Mrp/NBP35 family ATP-binding protein [Eubacteriales bacterium]|nr:Mrp/NBP35 family ATP-binding protein [Eubacteriales bacterium]